MTLIEYLTQQKMTQRQFAQLVELDPAQVTRWVKGERLPSLQQVAQIEQATGGAVKADDWMAALRSPIGGQAA